MKYIFALVCLIALASSQLKNKDYCDVTNWSDYTDADCTDEPTLAANVATMTVCKDVA